MAKNKSENQTAVKRVHFNVIDAFIIILILAIAAGIYFRASIVDKLWAQTQSKDYDVSFSVDNIRYTTPTYVELGDKVYFAESGEYFGTLISASDNASALSIFPASEYFSVGGEMLEVFYPDETRIAVKGRIHCSGYYDEAGGFSIDGRQYIAPGQSVKICTELVTLTVNITGIELSESEAQ